MIDARQIALVQDSFMVVVPVTAIAAADFYDELFARAPETRALFRNDMAEQGRKLFLTLAAVVDGLDRLDEIVPVARELAIRHVRYGALPHHYDVVGTALLTMLRRQLGPRFDTETEAAWAAAYTLLADTMVDAARQAA